MSHRRLSLPMYLAAAMLAACQQTAPVRESPATVVAPAPAPVAAAAPQQPASAQPAQQARPQAQPQNANIINFHLAQAQAGQGFVPLNLGNNQTLYVLDQAVLTREHLQRVSAVQNPQGQTFVRFDFNSQGATRLGSVTRQAQGRYLLLNLNGQPISLSQIDGAIDNGVLLVRTTNAEQSEAILQKIRAGR